MVARRKSARSDKQRRFAEGGRLVAARLGSAGLKGLGCVQLESEQQRSDDSALSWSALSQSALSWSLLLSPVCTLPSGPIGRISNSSLPSIQSSFNLRTPDSHFDPFFQNTSIEHLHLRFPRLTFSFNLSRFNSQAHRLIGPRGCSRDLLRALSELQ
ncbi:hypothetical protein A0H81_06162 [Grifola frondosa]|uniref:Uncharacterized protein n=1 Tax=Grifola frondosa TaxID=5627 RepID=A0A1C7MAZ8_GRIFR|nr:hypothetical protein A0H81_06162 [Grifola frondosa]